MRVYQHCKAAVFNRGVAPNTFLDELIEWGRSAPEDIFAVTSTLNDIYNKVKPELGPWEVPPHRRAVMLEVMRVLAGFESSWDWTEGIDTSRLGPDTPENAEAGSWQVSYDSRYIAPELREMLEVKEINDGIEFQRITKFDHLFAMEYVSRLMRKNTLHNGPLYKGEERLKIRKSLRAAEHSIYPWLRRRAVVEFMGFLA